MSSGTRLPFHRCPVLYPVATVSNGTVKKKASRTISGKSAYLLLMMMVQEAGVTVNINSSNTTNYIYNTFYIR